jgi:hypothetical protein
MIGAWAAHRLASKLTFLRGYRMPHSFRPYLLLLALVGLHCGNPDDRVAVVPNNDGGSSPEAGGQAPIFGGVRGATAVDEHQLNVWWDAATDDRTPQDRIVYRIFAGLAADKIDFTKPLATTPSGAKSAIVPGLTANRHYFVAVRALDGDGNVDSNTKTAETDTPDRTAPTFAGVERVVGVTPTSIRAEWRAASDEGSDPSKIKYALYLSETSGGQDFSTPLAPGAVAGVTSIEIGGLLESHTYYVVVRAIDENGNVAASTVEKSAMTTDATPPTFGGLTTAAASGTKINLSWSAASDVVDPASEITYVIYQAVKPGGYDFTKPPAYSVKGATTFTANGLDASVTYYFVVHARDKSGNEDANIVERSAKTAASPDIKAPTFGGVVTASAASKTSIELAWAEASDDYSLPANITYEIYVSTTPGAEDFGSTARTIKGGTKYTVTSLAANTTYYFVVRARDEAGNVETNTIEKTAKTLP